MDLFNSNSSDNKHRSGGKQSDGKSGSSNSPNQRNSTSDQKEDMVRKGSRSPEMKQNSENSSDPRKKVIKEENNEEHFQSNVTQQFPLAQVQSAQPQQLHQAMQPPVQSMVPSYNHYGYRIDPYNVDASQGSYPVIGPYQMYQPMNNQWPCTQMEGMAVPMNAMPGNPVIPVPNLDGPSNTNVGNYPYYMPALGEMYGMMRYWNYNVYPPESPPKQPIQLSTCSLLPPDRNTIIQLSERPLACKTVLCWGLPEKITEEIVREVFSTCGEITTIRMSKKNFCHIRFAAEEYVDEAMKLSAYRLKIEHKDEPPYASRIYINFARARDDELDYECTQTVYQRKARHRERQERDALRQPSPPPVADYSE